MTTTTALPTTALQAARLIAGADFREFGPCDRATFADAPFGTLICDTDNALVILLTDDCAEFHHIDEDGEFTDARFDFSNAN